MAGKGNTGCIANVRIAVFCSGNGSNFEALVKKNRRSAFPGKIVLMVVDNARAYAIERARRLKIPVLYIDPSAYKDKQAYEEALYKELKFWKINLILLAGFMRILSPFFVRKYRNRILNIHPSLLPAFKGANAIKDAFDYGVKVTGVTVHIVNEGVDEGPVLLQKAVEVSNNDTLASLETKIHKIEHRIYAEAVNLFLTSKWRIEKKRKFVLCN